jgi:hypothetical protein
VGGAALAQHVGRAHAAVPQRRLAQRRELVDDGVGAEASHGGEQCLSIEHVGDHRVGALRLQPRGARGRTGDADDVMPRGAQPGNQRTSEGAGRSGEQDPHDLPSVKDAAARSATASR